MALQLVKLFKCQLAHDKGSLAIPQAKMYFIAFQLQQLMGWDTENLKDLIQGVLLTQLIGYLPHASWKAEL